MGFIPADIPDPTINGGNMEKENDNFTELHEKLLSENIHIDMSVYQCLALLHTVKEALQDKIKTHAKLFFEEANGNKSAYNSCKEIIEIISPLFNPDSTKVHKDMFEFFSKDLFSNNDRLSFIENEGEIKEAREFCNIFENMADAIPEAPGAKILPFKKRG